MSAIEKLQSIKIDGEFERICPPLTADEEKRLEENILADGEVTSPLIVWNGILLDGHNRRRIILKHPELPFSIREMEFDSRTDAKIWICKNQLGRRNLTEQQRAYLIGMQYMAEKFTHGGADRFRGKKFMEGINSPVLDGFHGTRERIAREHGVSEAFVRQSVDYANGVEAAERIEPGIKEEILSGSIKAPKGEVSAIAKALQEEQRQLVENLRKTQAERRTLREKVKEAHSSKQMQCSRFKKCPLRTGRLTLGDVILLKFHLELQRLLQER